MKHVYCCRKDQPKKKKKKKKTTRIGPMLAAVAATTTNISYGSCIYMAAIKLLSSFSIASSNVQYAYGYSKGVHREEEEEEEPSEQFYWLYHISSVGEWLFTIDQSRKKKGRETEKEEEEKEERREGRVSNPLYLIHTYKQTDTCTKENIDYVWHNTVRRHSTSTAQGALGFTPSHVPAAQITRLCVISVCTHSALNRRTAEAKSNYPLFDRVLSEML